MDIYNPVYPGLYYFDTFTFTSLGTSGHRGPDSTKTYANAPWREGDFSIVEGQQQWTVPATGTYRIEAAGAYGATPGRVVSGDVDLNEGQVVSLLVGQQPNPLVSNVADNVTVGGGGGTFVTVEGKPLIVASGGDGGAYSTGYQSTTFVDPGTIQPQVSMSADGNTIVIQTINLNTFAVGFSVYTYVNSVWTYKTSLSPTFTSYNNGILKISGDGTTFVYFIPTTLSFPYVLVYQYDAVNSVWIPTPVTLQNPVNFQRNGSTIDISYDGSTIIRSFVSSVDSQGHACVYTKNPDFTWNSPVVLNEPGANYWIDTTVAISGDGLTACVGAQSSSPVIVYKKSGGNWNQDSTLSYNPQKISMSYDGSVVAFMFSDHVSITNGVTISYTSPDYIQLSNDGTKLLVARYDNVTIYTGDTPTVVTQYINFNNNTAASMNATGSRITSLEISITDPKIDVFDIGTGGAPGSFTPSGTGIGISGAGYLTDGEVSSPYFGFLKPQAYVDGGFGNSYWYGHKGDGGFGGGQSPLNILTSLTSITGYNAIRPTIPLNSDQYIYSVDISDDGNTFLVTRSFSNSRVYVYQYTGSSWGATQLYDNKLYSVSMSLDGTVWLIQNDIWRNGSFETQLEVPEVISGAGGGAQGKNTCVSSDGNTAVITNTSYTYNIQYNSIPELYCNVYAYSSGSWNKINTFHIIHNSMVFGEPYTEVDNVATRCAISGDGNTMATGTRTYLNVYNGQSYVRQTIYVNVYVYKKTGGTWNQTKQITFEYPYGGAEGGSMNHLVIDYSGNKIVFPGYEYTCDTDTLTAFGDVSQLTTTITFSKTTTNVYAWSDGQTIYGPSTPDGFKVELVNSCTILAFGSNVLLTTDSVFSDNKAIVFVDMYNPTTTCTANTSVDYHGYPHNYQVQITGTSSFNGTWDIVTTSSNTFTFHAFGGPTETSGYVSGTTTGISGGGGYTGSPGDGVSGATCYADPAVRNFTDLGAASNSAGYVTVSLIDPVPVKQSTTLNPWVIQPTAFAPTTTWSSVAYGNGVYVSVSNNGTFPVMYSTNGIDWFTTTTGAATTPWTSVTFGNGTFAAVSRRNVMYSRNGINWTSVNPTGYTYFSTGINSIQSLVTNSDGSVIAVGGYNDLVKVYKNGSLIYTLPEYGFTPCAINYDGSIVSRNGNVYTNGTLTRSYPSLTIVDMNADGTRFIFSTGEVYENETLLYTIPIDYYYFLGLAMNDDGTIVTLFNYEETIVYTNGVFTYNCTYLRSFEDDVFFAASKDGTTQVVNSYTLEPGFFVGTLLVYKNGVLLHNILDPSSFGPICISYDGSVITAGNYVYVNGVFKYNEPDPPSIGYEGRDLALSWDAKVFLNGVPYDGNSRVYQFLQLTPVADWTSVTYGNELFMSLSTVGESMYSSDASSWVYGNTVSASSITSLTYGDNKFVAVGTSNVTYSTDGYIWSNVTTGTTSNSWTAVSYGNGRFTVISSNATSMYSLNGVDWTTGGSPGVSSNCLAYGAGYFTCPSSNSEVSAVSISTDGQTWQTIPLTYTAAAYSGITYGERGFVAVSSSGLLLGFVPTFWVSPTQVANSTKLNSKNWSDLAYGNGSFVAVGQGLIQTTQDYGNTWSAFMVSNTLASVTYSSDLGTFVALPGFFGDGSYTSTDGLTWTLNQTLPSVQSAQTSLTYGDGNFVALLDGDSNIFYSRDGINWDVTTTSNVGASWSVAYGNQLFTAVSNCITSYSYDATNWTSVDHSGPAYSFNAGFPAYGAQMAMSSDGSVVCAGGTVYINGVFAYILPCDGGVAMNSDGSIIAVCFSGTIRVYKNGVLDNIINHYAFRIEMNSDGTIIGGSDSYYEVQIYTNGILSYTLPTTQNSFGLNGDGTIVATHYSNNRLHVYKNGNLLYSISTDGSGGIDGSLIKLSSDGTILAHSTDRSSVGISVFKYSTLLYKINDGTTTATQFAMSSDGSLIIDAPFLFFQPDLGPKMYRNGELLYQIQNSSYLGYYAMNSNGSIIGWWDIYSGIVYVYNSFFFYSWSSVTYGNGLFVAVANPGSSMYSTDGINWLPGNAPIDTWTSVSYGGGYFVAVSDNGTYPVMYSQDGINWLTTDPGSQFNNWGSVAFGGDTFLAIPTSGATTMTNHVTNTF